MVPEANAQAKCTLGPTLSVGDEWAGQSVLVGQVWGGVSATGFYLRIADAGASPAVWIDTRLWTVEAL